MEKLTPTVKFISEIIKKDPECDLKKEKCDVYLVNVQVDPLLFRRYNITTVPALLYVKGIKVLNPGSEGLMNNASVDKYYIAYGDASIEYLLSKIQEETKSESLKGLIHSLRSGFYQYSK